MRTLAWMILAAAAALSSPAAHAQKAVAVEKGAETFLTLERPVHKLSVGDTGIADVSPIDDTTLRILGQGVGKTTFAVWHRAKGLPETYTVSVSPALGDLERHFRTDPNLARGQLYSRGGKVLLDGTFADEGSRERARTIAAFMTGAEVVDVSRVDVDEVVQVEIRFAAVARSTLDSLGLDFRVLGQDFAMATAAPGTLSGFAFNTGPTPALAISSGPPIASAFNLLIGSPKFDSLAIISALESSQLAKTLAEPVLVVRSGQEADFIVGGEFPVPVPQGGTSNAITIEFKKFGISLAVKPTILEGRKIDLYLRPEVSELDFANGIALEGFAIPAIRTRSTQTVVTVGENQTLILAGLTLRTDGALEEKVPFLGDIPILGEFFKRTQDTEEEQELIVSVTPRLVTAASQDQGAQDDILARFAEPAKSSGEAAE